MQTKPSKALLDLNDLHLEYGNSPWTFRRAAYDGKLAFIRLCGDKKSKAGKTVGKLWFRREDVEAFINRYRVPAIGER